MFVNSKLCNIYYKLFLCSFFLPHYLTSFNYDDSLDTCNSEHVCSCEC